MFSGEATFGLAHMNRLHPRPGFHRGRSHNGRIPEAGGAVPHFTDGMWGLAPIPVSKDPTLLGGPRGFSTVSIFTYQKTESPTPSHLWKQMGKRKRESTPGVCQMERSNTPPNPGS